MKTALNAIYQLNGVSASGGTRLRRVAAGVPPAARLENESRNMKRKRSRCSVARQASSNHSAFSLRPPRAARDARHDPRDAGATRAGSTPHDPPHAHPPQPPVRCQGVAASPRVAPASRGLFPASRRKQGCVRSNPRNREDQRPSASASGNDPSAIVTPVSPSTRWLRLDAEAGPRDAGATRGISHHRWHLGLLRIFCSGKLP